jgi:porin
MKTKTFFISLLFGYASAFANNHQANLPYGNLGLDYIADTINSNKQQMVNETGISPFFNYYADFFGNVSGGNHRNSDYTHIMTFGVDIDLQKTIGLKGGSFTISGAYNTGHDLSRSIGNFFTISQSAVTNGAMFYELYYAQTINLPNDDSITISAGRMSMADKFASLAIFGNLSSGAIDSTPESIFYASPYTSLTIATWGIAVDYQTSNNLTFSIGLYQTPQNENSSSWNGTDFSISSDDGYMMLFQVAWSPTFCGNLQGSYQVGGYFFDGYNMPYLNTSITTMRDDGYGFYLQGQQTVWVDNCNPSKNISIWAGTQYSPVESISPIHWQLYAGAQLQGFVPCRPNDSIFLSWTTGFFSGDYNNGNSSNETIFEVNYLYQINNNFSIQPAMQYVLNPNGQSNIDDAFVLGMQMTITF